MKQNETINLNSTNSHTPCERKLTRLKSLVAIEVKSWIRRHVASVADNSGDVVPEIIPGGLIFHLIKRRELCVTVVVQHSPQFLGETLGVHRFIQ